MLVHKNNAVAIGRFLGTKERHIVVKNKKIKVRNMIRLLHHA